LKFIKSEYNQFIIRQADNSDILSIKNLVFTVLREYGLKPDETGRDIDLNDIEKNYTNRNGFFGVVVDNITNQIAGTFGLYYIDKDICELRKMYLRKDLRGQGIGKFMLRSAINIAGEKSYQKIFLETISPLKEAIALYKKFGFAEVKPHEINERVNMAFELIIR